MKVDYYSPFSFRSITGGSIYNDELIKFLIEKNSEVNICIVSNLEKISYSENAVLVDGLLCRTSSKQISNKVFVLMHLPAFEDHCSQEEIEKEKKILQSSAGVIVPHLAVKNRIAHEYDLNSGKILVIEPGITEKAIKKTEYRSTPQKLINVGNFNKIKNQKGLIDQLETIKDLNWTLDFYGKGEEKDKVIQKCLETGLINKVFFHDPIPHDRLLSIYQNYDLSINYSTFETYGMFIMESIYCGVPLLTKPVGWIKETTYEGCLSQEHFSEKLHSLLTNKEEYQSLVNHTIELSRKARPYNFNELYAWMRSC